MTEKDLERRRRAAPIEGNAQLLLQLAERCEREDASSHLDADIECMINPQARHADAGTKIVVGLRLRHAHSFTSSLDTAVTLVPVGAWRETNGPRRYLNIPTPVPNFWHCNVSLYAPTYGDFHGWAATEALAICAASLRARAAEGLDATEEQAERSEDAPNHPVQEDT